MSKIIDLLKQYREGAEGTGNPVSKKANTSHDQMHVAYKQLRECSDGKVGIVALMADENPHVKCWAAAHSLAWEPDKARAVLEELRDFRGACSFDAEMVLEQFDAGKLTFEY
ncbi:MAG TPA: hypothetical protein VFY06_08860 [Verrucomicrobiae bacterium]|nr:hypothetical protein [Verrucomicrobiae bacterium]